MFAEEMKIHRRDLYQVAGIGMIVGAFFAAAKALGGVLSLVFIVASTDFTSADPSYADNVFNALKGNQIFAMVHGIGSFLILFFGGRWMLRGPKLLDRWAGSHQEDGEEAPDDRTGLRSNDSEEDAAEEPTTAGESK